MRALLPLQALTLVLLLSSPVAASEPATSDLQRAIERLDLRTGILYDRAAPLSGIERFDGEASSPAADAGIWRQIVFEMRRSANDPSRFPDLATLGQRANRVTEMGAIPLALLDCRYERIRPGAPERAQSPTGDIQLVEARAVASAALHRGTYRGRDVSFVLPRDLCLADVAAGTRIEADFDDGRGYRLLALDQPARVSYGTTGTKTIRLRVTDEKDQSVQASAAFPVKALQAPAPDDTLQITATIPFQGQFGTGKAYVDLAPGHIRLANPIVVIEGFDLDNSMHWDELYAQLNQQNLLENLRADGFDAVVLDFTDATDYIERNAYVVEALIEQVQQAIDSRVTIAVVGASMGGLCSRFALADLEARGGHRVRTWVSFDAPHLGADIPLGIQYWVNFFSGLSSDAAYLRDLLNTPAAREMLLYHFTDPPSPAAPDPLKATLASELAALGDYPALPRRVAIANGSGARLDQGFQPAEQIIRYEYSTFGVDIRGNVWALPDQVSGTIFQGRLHIIFSDRTQTVTASATKPWDGAPGGWRATMAQMDAVAAPYGDIVALHPNHCFIPVISSLALATQDPFYDVAGDPALLDHTPFDAVFVPPTNEEHVTVSPAAAVWLEDEIRQGVVSAASPARDRLALRTPFPNPFAASTRIGFTLPSSGSARLRIIGVDGREVIELARGSFAAGPHEAIWNGRDARGRLVPAGLYFASLNTSTGSRSARLVRVD